MKKKHHDVVIFPKWKKQLEKDSLEALKEKRYHEALDYIEQLEKYQAASNEILTGKIISLIELKRYDDAIALCRTLMAEDPDNYFKYLHIYITILFQASKYREVIEILDEIFEHEQIPSTYINPFRQLYELSKKFVGEEQTAGSRRNVERFIHNLRQGSLKEQWHSLSQVREEDARNFLHMIKPFLTDQKLNPVIKTGILQWLHEQNVEQEFDVEKFGEIHRVNPVQLRDIMEQDVAKEIMSHLDELEHINPTLLEFARQILYRFLYIYYPFFPEKNSTRIIARAIQTLAMDYLNVPYRQHAEDESAKLEYWKQKISQMEVQYFSPLEKD